MKETRKRESVAVERARSLRWQAEEQLRTTRSDIQRMSPEDVQRLVYELQINQIELQLQNEELQRAQLELATARDRYGDLYDFAPVGYVTLSSEGVVLEANLTAATLLGTERAHLVGMRLERFLRADGRDTLTRHLRRFHTEQGLRTCEVAVPRPDGPPMTLKLESVAVGEEQGTSRRTRTILSDMTTHKQAEEALRTLNETLEQRVAERTHALQASEERYRDLFDNASDLLATMTLEGVFTGVNRSVEQYLGYSPEEMLGKNWRDFTTPDSIALVEAHLNRTLVEGIDPPMYEFEAIHKEGRTVLFEGRVRYIRDHVGSPIALHGMYRDITQRKEVDRLKEELVSTVSHELRTPLTSMRGFTELLLTRDFTPQQRHNMLSVMQQEAIRLTTLINDFLDLQRMAEGRYPYAFEAVGLDSLLREAIAVFSSGQEQHPLQVDIQGPLPLVHADPHRVRQVLRNLLSNAIKYSPDGGPVSVNARCEGEEVVVWITDQGIGIPAEAFAKLFTKFFRVNNTATRQIGGTGLGLALVKEILHAHHGRVWVESTMGKGSTFFFTIPRMADRVSPAANIA